MTPIEMTFAAGMAVVLVGVATVFGGVAGLVGGTLGLLVLFVEFALLAWLG